PNRRDHGPTAGLATRHHHHGDSEERRWNSGKTRTGSRVLPACHHALAGSAHDQSGINKLRYATLLGIKQAKNKPLRKVSLDEVKGSLGTNLQKIEKLYIPQKSKKTEMLEGPPAEVAKKLVEKLRNEVRVI